MQYGTRRFKIRGTMQGRGGIQHLRPQQFQVFGRGWHIDQREYKRHPWYSDVLWGRPDHWCSPSGGPPRPDRSPEPSWSHARQMARMEGTPVSYANCLVSLEPSLPIYVFVWSFPFSLVRCYLRYSVVSPLCIGKLKGAALSGDIWGLLLVRQSAGKHNSIGGAPGVQGRLPQGERDSDRSQGRCLRWYMISRCEACIRTV